MRLFSFFSINGFPIGLNDEDLGDSREIEKVCALPRVLYLLGCNKTGRKKEGVRLETRQEKKKLLSIGGN